MEDDPNAAELRMALAEIDPANAVYALAVQLRDRGMSQFDLETLYKDELGRHRNNPDEIKWDAIADTLDFIVGWCSESQALFAYRENTSD